MGQIGMTSLSYTFSPNQIYPSSNLSLQVGPVRPWPRHVAGGGCGDRGRHRRREGGGANSMSRVAALGTQWKWGGTEREGVAAPPKLIRLKCTNYHRNVNQG